MTYCVGLRLDRGIVFASDTRTNAGVDNVSVFNKMHVWERKGDRVLVLLSAGNLSLTQAVVSLLNERLHTVSETGLPSLMTVETMFQAARLVGQTVREVLHEEDEAVQANPSLFVSSFIFGGQIGGDVHRLFQIYQEGNFIEATKDTPYFQIGEHKYGKPILDRVTVSPMRMGEAAKLVLISFDSTLRSNLSVGLPIDLLIYRKDTLEIGEQRRIDVDDPYFRKLSHAWSEALRDAFARLEEYEAYDPAAAPEFQLATPAPEPAPPSPQQGEGQRDQKQEA
ncbi:proteasome-type protease [Afifella sp. IM 167]|uniref:proteasome-type protease n=1 Tax=Afifella sp. IM 167 TaxID=2033586 RepID=UPI001CCC2D37|nr:proteasome-type protease [Afifella sp. IM 167]